jgi:sphingosine kinase
MALNTGDDDPFRDPSLASTAPQPPLPPPESTREHSDAPDTLAVGRNASLTLGTDSLIVLGMPASRTTENVC